MMYSVKQIRMIHTELEKYPEADTVVIKTAPNGSGIGPTEIAVFQDRGNLFKRIQPVELGSVNITDVATW